MGYGIDGTFRPADVARLIEREGVDVVLLSEVDRGWLLNGGQDQLAILARLLGMRLAFGPAADQVWGDAIHSRLPLRDLRTERLPAHDSLTGAQALAATVAPPQGSPLRVLSTHVQPDAGGPEPSLAQARDIAVVVERERQLGLPVVLGGDFNLEPGGREFDAITRTGLRDALAEARPLLTSSSDDPRTEIDHVFVSPELPTSRPRSVRSLLSDQLPVLVLVTLP